MTAQELFEKGYVGLSNKYRIVARIDRPDWVEKLARELNRSVADFYFYRNGRRIEGYTGHWGEHYCAVYSRDTIEGVDPETYQELKRLWSRSSSDVVYKEIPIVG